MRLAIDATCLGNRRGFGRFVRELLPELAELGKSHEITALLDQNPEPGELPPGLRAQVVAPSRRVTESAVAGGRRSWSDMRRFTSAVSELKPDLFFFPAVYSFFPLPKKTRSVICFHDTIAERFPELVFPNRRSRWAWKAKCWLARRQATRIMTVSETSKRDLESYFKLDPAKIDVVTEGPGLAFRKRPSDDAILAARTRYGVQERRYLLFVGGLSPHKNLRSLLVAWSLVAEKTDALLVITGDPKADGFLAEGEELMQRVGTHPTLSKRVRFTGFVPDVELAALYAGAEALVMPSLAEGFGLPAIEAMAVGTPVLASDRGSLPEIVGESGVIFDVSHPSAVTTALLSVLDHPDRRAALAAKAMARAQEFSWRRAAELCYASFEKALR